MPRIRPNPSRSVTDRADEQRDEPSESVRTPRRILRSRTSGSTVASPNQVASTPNAAIGTCTEEIQRQLTDGGQQPEEHRFQPIADPGRAGSGRRRAPPAFRKRGRNVIRDCRPHIATRSPSGATRDQPATLGRLQPEHGEGAQVAGADDEDPLASEELSGGARRRRSHAKKRQRGRVDTPTRGADAVLTGLDRR